MPLHWYVCDRDRGGCGHRVEEYRSVHEGGDSCPPICPHCSALTDYPGERDVPMRRVIQSAAMDIKSVFQRFEITRQVVELDAATGLPSVQNKVEVIDSVTKMRAVEKDSEQRFRNGEGEPLRFRMWSNGATNRDVSAFGAQGKIGDEEYSSGEVDSRPKKSGKVSIKRHGQTEPEVVAGPGMGGQAQSTLKGPA